VVRAVERRAPQLGAGRVRELADEEIGARLSVAAPGARHEQVAGASSARPGRRRRCWPGRRAPCARARARRARELHRDGVVVVRGVRDPADGEDVAGRIDGHAERGVLVVVARERSVENDVPTARCR
jgi:hypothetical protein